MVFMKISLCLYIRKKIDLNFALGRIRNKYITVPMQMTMLLLIPQIIKNIVKQSRYKLSYVSKDKKKKLSYTVSSEEKNSSIHFFIYSFRKWKFPSRKPGISLREKKISLGVSFYLLASLYQAYIIRMLLRKILE